MQKRLALPLLAVLIVFAAIAYFLTPDELQAQVMSGPWKIGDMSIDEGGGSRKSGNVTLANTSIGQPFAGAYVVNNKLVVGGGHAYKADYCYKQGCPDLVGLEKLVIKADEDAGATANTGYDYDKRLSGLRTADDPSLTPEEQGNQYYNNLLVQPHIFGDRNLIQLAGAAFTEKGYLPNNDTRVVYRPFASLLDTVTNSFGFLAIYANKDAVNPLGPTPGSGQNQSGCTSNFCSETYYVYAGGEWQRIPIDRTVQIRLGGRVAMTVSIHADSLPPKRPTFSVAMFKPLAEGTRGDTAPREWETYGFVTSTGNLAGEISKADPTDFAPLAIGDFYASSVKSTFYLFAL